MSAMENLKERLTIMLSGMNYRKQESDDAPVPEPPHPKKK
jgi:hypothetical protein